MNKTFTASIFFLLANSASAETMETQRIIINNTIPIHLPRHGMKREPCTVLFDLLSPLYDTLIKWLCLFRGGPSYEENIRRTIMEYLDVEEHHTLLEIGIGTGINLSHLNHHPLKIVGVDPALGMLKVCARRLFKRGLDGELFCRSAERLEMADDSFDRVLCVNVLMYVPSPDTITREMLRVLRPTGKLVLTVRSRWLVKHGPLPFRLETGDLAIKETKQGISTIFIIQKNCQRI
jgi:SAM-dependent methyltransferase